MRIYVRYGLIVAGISIGLIALFIIYLFIVGMIGFGPGRGDWIVKLPNHYEMWEINGQNICIGIPFDNGLSLQISGVGISGDIIEFCSNDSYVGAQQVDVPTDTQKGVDTTSPRYYLLDTLKQKVYGPFDNESQFNNMCSELKVSRLSVWEKTSPPPRNAIFGP
jgi:hypothetical protein